MSAIGNFLWFVLGGVFMGLGWWLVGLLAFVTIVGIPWGRACFVIGQFSFFPFGKEAIDRKTLTSKDDIGTSGAGTVGNIIWFVFAGWYIALSHLIIAVAEFVSIIGIPFALKDLELAKLAVAPVGRTIREKA